MLGEMFSLFLCRRNNSVVVGTNFLTRGVEKQTVFPKAIGSHHHVGTPNSAENEVE